MRFYTSGKAKQSGAEGGIWTPTPVSSGLAPQTSASADSATSAFHRIVRIWFNQNYLLILSLHHKKSNIFNNKRLLIFEYLTASFMNNLTFMYSKNTFFDY